MSLGRLVQTADALNASPVHSHIVLAENKLGVILGIKYDFDVMGLSVLELARKYGIPACIRHPLGGGNRILGRAQGINTAFCIRRGGRPACLGKHHIHFGRGDCRLSRVVRRLRLRRFLHDLIRRCFRVSRRFFGRFLLILCRRHFCFRQIFRVKRLLRPVLLRIL